MAVNVLSEKEMMSAKAAQKAYVLEDPAWVEKLFSNTRMAWLWGLVRFYLGYVWFTSGLEKTENPAWMAGTALKGFWERAIQIPDAPARPLIAFDWYRSFLQFLLDGQAYIWFAKLVAYGEIVVGIALILGIFSGFAAFFGGFMNWNYMMAGTASINPVMFPLSILLILAWKIAGYWGGDRWLLPLLGAPWQPGKIFLKTTG